MRTIRKLISIASGTYNARKFRTRRTSGSVRGPESMRTRISRYTAEVLRIRLLRALEVAHAIEVRVLTIEL